MHDNKLNEIDLDIFVFGLFSLHKMCSSERTYIPDVTSRYLLRPQSLNIQGKLIGDFIFDSPPAQQNEVLAKPGFCIRNAPSPGKCAPLPPPKKNTKHLNPRHVQTHCLDLGARCDLLTGNCQNDSQENGRGF